MGMHNSTVLSTEEDLEMELKLAKKLNVKAGKLRGEDDRIKFLCALPIAQQNSEKSSESKKRKKKKNMSLDHAPGSEIPDNLQWKREQAYRRIEDKEVNGKYITPHIRACAGNESEKYTQIRRRLRGMKFMLLKFIRLNSYFLSKFLIFTFVPGLLNRLSESNVESITREISNIFYPITSGAASQIISKMYAAVFGTFVAGMACFVGNEFSAKLMASLAKYFEYHKEDNLSVRNITLSLSYLYSFGIFSGDMIYDFLLTLSKRLTDVDVSIILTTLQRRGLKIRPDDPAAMKKIILSVQDCVNELKVSPNLCLKLYVTLRTTGPKVDPVHHTGIKRWLKKLRVENILIRGLKWSKLLDPEKKGQWWLSGDMASTMDNVEEVANTIDKEVLEPKKCCSLLLPSG
ncbi:nucleolar mif4g domain-containing protein 1 like protein [Quercus suber]|uniref:Nucleolar mif4g domain-containing protein 1 like protein n=1 Tax=Quercus suber TaxID=58331 RepID=A0AAW0ILP6_QUESU